MCVAIYKPEGVACPSLDVLHQCWIANPDGAGFAIPSTASEKHAYEIHKGFMTWQAFEEAYKQYGLENQSGAMLIHFRIATHGGVSQGNCHPFPITASVKLLKEQHIYTNSVLIHNGMLPIEPEFKDISDTMELCKRIAQCKGRVPECLRLIDGMIGTNKIAVMHCGNVHLLGQWKEVDGVYFSNLNWQCRGFYYDYYGGWNNDEYECEDASQYDDATGWLTADEVRTVRQEMICPWCCDALIEDKHGHLYCPCCQFRFDDAINGKKKSKKNKGDK
jgi:hypothetical protein